MPPSRKNVKCKYLLKKAGGEPVRKTIAKPTAGWKPIRWRCTLCKRPKKWPGEVCPCVEQERWRAKMFDWRAPLETAPCHCGQPVLTCGCEDEKSPKHSHIQYEEDGLSGWPVQEHEIDYEEVMMTYKQMMRRVRDKLETLLAHWGPDADIIALDDRFDESGAAGGAAGGTADSVATAADSAAKAAEKAPDVINLVSSDDEKEAGMSP